MSVRRLRIAVALAVLLPLVGLHAQPSVPPLTGRVVDLADLLSESRESSLTTMLANHESSTTHQIAVLTIPSLEGEAIEPYATRVFRDWALGQEGLDNGILLLVARDDRELRIEVGYGLEASLTDAEAGHIIRNIIVPVFRQGDFEVGITSGVSTIMAVLDGNYEVPTSKPLAVMTPGRQRWDAEAFFALFVMLVGFFVAFWLVRGWVVKTGGKSYGWRVFSFIVRWAVGGGGLGIALFLAAPLSRMVIGLGYYEWWEGLWLGFLIWPLVALVAEWRVGLSPLWMRYRQSQEYVEREKAYARKKQKLHTIHTWGRTIVYDGRPGTTSSGSSSGSSWSSGSSGWSSSSSSFSSSSFSGGGGSSGGGGASGSW